MICLGIDWGKKRIGLALGDSSLLFAWPLKTVSSLREILEIIEKEEVEKVILGCPYKFNKEADLDPIFLSFYKKVKENFPEVILVDERLSSRAVDSLRGGKKKASRDQLSAMIILQSYFDSL